MSNCTHCGKPAGLLRSYHVDCRAQFERAVTTIPAFFEKLLHSLLPAERFEQLLNEVAATFHIDPKRLRSLSMMGVNAMLDSALSQRIPTVAEEDRILDIATTLGLSVSDIPGLTDKFVKISILRDLDEGRVPDHVTVVGPMPFEFEPDEAIVWIFNGVRSYRQPKPKERVTAESVTPARGDLPDYVSPASVSPTSAPIREWVDTGASDLMFTDRRIFVVSEDRHRHIPLSKIASLRTFADGFQIQRPADDRALVFIVDDSWFAANLIVRLMRLPLNLPAREPETGSAEAT
jgi:hypothetical protein